MTNWIITNLQLVAMLVVGLGGLIGLLTYSRERLEDENGEPYRKLSGARFKRTAVATAAAGLLVLTFPFIPAGYEGVVFDRRPNTGVLEEPRGEGFTFTIPLVQSATNMNVRKQLYTVDSNVQTKDLQEVLLPVSVNYLVKDSPSVYQEVGVNYLQAIIDPAVFQAITESAGKVTAESIAFSRTTLTQAVARRLTTDLARHGIMVVDVAIRDAVFDKDFILSVKNKVIADQKAAEAEKLIEVARSEAEQVRLRARGDGDAVAILGASEKEAISSVASALGFTPEQYLNWVQVTSWNGALPTTLLDSTSEFDLILAPAK